MLPGTLLYVTTALILFMSVCGVVDCRYNITRLDCSQSFYFEPITKIGLVKSKWELVAFYNMSSYWEGTQAFEKVTAYLDKACNNIDSELCTTRVPQLIQKRNYLKHYNKLLMMRKVSRQSRRRRGLTTRAGYSAKSVPGALDEQLAEKYTRDINMLKPNTMLLGYWHNKTSFVENKNKLFTGIGKFIPEPQEIINNHLNTIQNISNKLQGEINNLSLLQDLTTMAGNASDLFETLNAAQTFLLDTLTEVYEEVFNKNLFAPGQLQHEAEVISKCLSYSYDIALPVKPIDISKLLSLVTVKARITEQYFLLQITFPLVMPGQHKLYKLHPVPQRTNSGVDVIEFIPSSEYVAMAPKSNFYVKFTSEELSLCKQKHDMLMCDWKKPIRVPNRNDLCELDRVTGKCTLNRSRCENKWTSLTNPSHYLFFTCSVYTVKVICGDQINITHLTKAGVIYLNTGCLLQKQDFTLNIQSKNKNLIVAWRDHLDSWINSAKQYFENVGNKSKLDAIHYSENLEKPNLKLVELPLPPTRHRPPQFTFGYRYGLGGGCGSLGVVVAVLLCRWLRDRRAGDDSDRTPLPLTTTDTVPVSVSAT